MIISPADKDIIQAESAEPHHLKRPVTGKISGFKREEIIKLQLSVEISIYTDTWYSQGTILVKEDGQWTFENACFAGVTHIVRAILRDKNHHQYTTVDHVITVQR